MPVKVEKQKGQVAGQVLAALLGIVVALGIVQILQSYYVQDTWKGLWYEPEEKIEAIEEALELTGSGKRIFRATQPTIENREDFNEHCKNQRMEVSLLGCYTGGKMYVYEITREQLIDSNKVTAAHELLHAAWERLSDRERTDVARMLEEVKEQNAEWLEQELQTYAEEDKLEEMYTRVGTKLAEIPEQLEEHYRKYFLNRQKIVAYYDKTQEPFEELQEKNDRLRTEIFAIKAEIAKERDAYLVEVTNLDDEIEEFNACAAEVGCFTAEAFVARRTELAEKQTQLNQRRINLNNKIEENNARVEEYQKNQAELGELNEAMDSRIEKGDLIYE